MIPIFEAIETQAWLTAELPPASDWERTFNNGEPIRFRLRATAFAKIDLSVVDGSENLSCRLDSNIWKLDLDVVNLCKRELPILVVCNSLFISDEDRFEFPYFDDCYLRLHSEYAGPSGMQAFYAGDLPPKIRRAGAFPYELPDEFDQLFITIRGGSLREA